MTITISGTSGVTYPAGGTDNVAGAGVGTTDSQTLTNKTLTSPTLNSPTIGGTPVVNGSLVVSGTAQASTSGTSIDFTSIPSWVKRITVMFSGVSTNGTANRLVQLGTSGGIVSSGYSSSSNYMSATTGNVSSTAGMIIYSNNASAALDGHLVLTNISGNGWVSSHAISWGTGTTATGGGSVSLSGVLDRIRITNVGGTDTFDAGSINILYE